MKLSEETKNKISLSLKGRKKSAETLRKLSETHKGQIPWNKGKHGVYSEDVRRKMGEARKGEKNYFWRGGISKNAVILRTSPEYVFWRKTCLWRDDFICGICLKRGGVLVVHHINNFSEFPEMRFNTGNGITLCVGCHKEFHKRFGKRNNTKGQLEQYINENRLV